MTHIETDIKNRQTNKQTENLTDMKTKESLSYRLHEIYSVFEIKIVISSGSVIQKSGSATLMKKYLFNY